MTNAEMAHGLSELARVYEKPENAELPRPYVTILVHDKAALLQVIRAIGGTFKKSANEYSLALASLRAPGVVVDIPRDKVCRKTITWDCEPMLSPDDEAEVDAAALATL